MRRDIFSPSSKLWPSLFFAGLLILGLRLAPDYGISIDEWTNHYFGVRWYDYARNIAFHHAPLAPLAGATEHDVVHGPFVEMTFAFVENALLRLSSLRQILFFRHYATWAVFYLGVVCFYFLARRLFASRAWALLAALFLVLHPRIFAHAFFDSVDLPFLAFYIFALATLVRFLAVRTLASLTLHAVVCAMMIDVRAIGAIIPAITGLILTLDLFTAPIAAPRIFRFLGRIGLFMAVVTLVTILCWPFLWNHPFLRALDIVHLTPKVDWAGIVLYRGEQIIATHLPWHYIPLWIAITTPIACLVFLVVGLADGLWSCLKNPLAFYRERLPEAVTIAALLLPLLAVIVLHVVVFDSWRHLFFVYPALVLVAIAGLKRTVALLDARVPGRARTTLASALAVLIALNFVGVAAFMIRNHPYEHVYFNRFAGQNFTEIKRRFELDYWALSYRAALEHVLATDPSAPLRIFHGNNSFMLINQNILPAAEQARLKSVGFDEAEYVFTNFRQVRGGYPTLPLYYSIEVDGESIFAVYKKIPSHP